MTGPIQSNEGCIFTFHSQGPQQHGVVSKVSEVTSKVLAKASILKTAATVLDQLKAPAPVKKGMDLETLLKMTVPVRDIILTGLTDIELNAFEIAISMGTAVKYQDTLKVLKGQIDKIKQQRLLNEILADNPTWKSKVEAWKGVSLEEKIWLLQLYELCNLGVEIPQIDEDQTSFIPSADTINLLESSTKKAITEALSNVTELYCYNKGLIKCPRAIGLLLNLQEINLNENKLTVPPDVSRNVNLKILIINDNRLTAPPDVSRNLNLQRLLLERNELTVPPDVSRNVNLQRLSLERNELTVAPDVSRNVHLQQLDLSDNKLIVSPDISQNVKLKDLYLERNQLIAPPDVTQNENLEVLCISQNRLTASPDVSKNVHLQMLYLSNNQLTADAIESLGKLKKERKKIKIDF